MYLVLDKHKSSPKTGDFCNQHREEGGERDAKKWRDLSRTKQEVGGGVREGAEVSWFLLVAPTWPMSQKQVVTINNDQD